jgi:hypothetical protein
MSTLAGLAIQETLEEQINAEAESRRLVDQHVRQRRLDAFIWDRDDSN